MNSKRKVIAVVGPTASGKTGIGVRLAKEFNGEIISADSRQVYRGLDLGTGKEGTPFGELPIINDQLSMINKLDNSKIDQLIENCRAEGFPLGKGHLKSEKLKIENLQRSLRCIDDIPQWLIDIAAPGERITLFDWLPLARLAIEDIFSRGKLPIIVGGTGLYVQGLVEGFTLKKRTNNQLSMINKLDNSEIGQLIENCPEGHSKSEKLKIDNLDVLSKQELQKILRSLDPTTFNRIDINNKHRLVRAIERAQEGLVPTKVKPDFEVLQIGIDLPRKELYERIDRRVDERFEKGMLEEVKCLIESGVDPEWLVKLGLEYREIASYLIVNDQLSIFNQFQNFKIKELNENCKLPREGVPLGKIENYSNFDSMKQNLKYSIHHFAKRQMTWFRRFPEINWLSDYDEMKRFARIFLEH
ncbi:MAG TPA: tRNA (adenosine(37)-N6)-dimethylallyltransferase MiaA [bacterium]|nr:tRNA (adenosine(37)-N6)-dimethylallyltransferase MiaA [bacterium]